MFILLLFLPIFFFIFFSFVCLYLGFYLFVYKDTLIDEFLESFVVVNSYIIYVLLKIIYFYIIQIISKANIDIFYYLFRALTKVALCNIGSAALILFGILFLGLLFILIFLYLYLFFGGFYFKISQFIAYCLLIFVILLLILMCIPVKFIFVWSYIVFICYCTVWIYAVFLCIGMFGWVRVFLIVLCFLVGGGFVVVYGPLFLGIAKDVVIMMLTPYIFGEMYLIEYFTVMFVLGLFFGNMGFLINYILYFQDFIKEDFNFYFRLYVVLGFIQLLVFSMIIIQFTNTPDVLWLYKLYWGFIKLGLYNFIYPAFLVFVVLFFGFIFILACLFLFLGGNVIYFKISKAIAYFLFFLLWLLYWLILIPEFFLVVWSYCTLVFFIHVFVLAVVVCIETFIDFFGWSNFYALVLCIIFVGSILYLYLL